MWFNLQTDFYRPLWIRLSIIAVCFGWAGFEFFTGGGLWAALFAFLGAVAFQQFFLDGWPASENTATENGANKKEAHEDETSKTDDTSV